MFIFGSTAPLSVIFNSKVSYSIMISYCNLSNRFTNFGPVFVLLIYESQCQYKCSACNAFCKWNGTSGLALLSYFKFPNVVTSALFVNVYLCHFLVCLLSLCSLPHRLQILSLTILLSLTPSLFTSIQPLLSLWRGAKTNSSPSPRPVDCGSTAQT